MYRLLFSYNMYHPSDILSHINSWCKERGIREPDVRKNWEYLGASIVEWLGPPAQCQLDLNLSKDGRTASVTFYMCNPLCVNAEYTYNVKHIADVCSHWEELFDTLDMFFPDTKDPVGFCTSLAKVVAFECLEIAKRERHASFDLRTSVYRKTYKNVLVKALNVAGFTQATYKMKKLTVSWDTPTTPQEQKLFDLFKK